ncbi:Smr/MutS family protein [bacterium]|nr:Smr/MutS family protein [bacterium]
MIEKSVLKQLDFDQIEPYFTENLMFSESFRVFSEKIFLDYSKLEGYFEILSELFRFLEDQSYFDFLKQPDITQHIPYIQKGLLLNPEDFLEIAVFAESLKNILDKSEKLKNMPKFQNFLQSFEDSYSPIDKIIYRVIDKNGQVKSTASKELLEIRKRIRNLEASIRAKIQEYLEKRDLNKYLQEDFYTIRKDRFVLPVKSSFQKHIEGIIHDRSNTGETVFIEPQDIVQVNNSLIIEKQKEEEEIRKILKELIEELKPMLPSINLMIKSYVEIDYLNARYLLSSILGGYRVNLNSSFEINLKKAINPLMKLQNRKTVPIDINLKNGDYALIVSGPNAGGKTVALKTFGMIYLLVNAGIFPPVEENSSIYIKNRLYCVIGDQQSIQNSESSFTSHLRELDRAFINAKNGDIVLVDEILQNTDPSTGVALAKGYIDAVSEKKAHVIVTTHYNELKYHALEKEGFVNASVKLHPTTMKPTYQLFYNQINESQPLQIAKELNVSQILIDKASKYLIHAESDTQRLITRLNAQIDEYNSMMKTLEDERSKYEKYKEDARKFKMEKSQFQLNKEKLLKEEIDKTVDKMKRYLFELNQKSKKDTEHLLKKLEEQSDKKQENIKQLQKETQTSDKKSVIFEDLKEGNSYFIYSIGKNGKVVQISRNRVILETENSMKITTTTNDLYHIEKTKEDEVKKILKKYDIISDDSTQIQKTEEEPMFRTPGNTLDIIGVDTYSSESMIEEFFNQLLMNRRFYGYIIHGHGTGKLKKHVRYYLSKHELVKKYQRAEQDDGGDAVTIVELHK